MSKKLLALLLSLYFLPMTMQAQDNWNVLYSPILGGATDHSVRILFFSKVYAGYMLQVAEDSAFAAPTCYMGYPDSTLHNCAIVNIENLKPATEYYYRIMYNMGVMGEYRSHFRTFPTVGTRQHYVVATGSCQETDNMKVYDVMAKHHPDIFIHTGDWTYPDYMIKDYPYTDTSIFKGYERRYTEKVMRNMLPYTFTDYLADNHDGIGGSAHNHVKRATYRIDTSGRVVNYFQTDTIMPIIRSRVIKGYADYYPGYPLQDTTIGIYHSFKMGNAEFFVIDIREDASFQVNAFKYDSVKNHWTFDPPAHGYNIIQEKQMNWLKEGLKNSKADWKFIVMGIPFNQNIRHIIDLGIHYQDLELAIGGEKGTGFRLAVSWAFYWAGYPQSSEDLLNFIHTNNIKDVLVISGDTHHNVMDDGRNAGLPEINASGLSVTGTVLAHYMNLIGRVSGYPNIKKWLWNGGGNGIHNKNYKNAYGQLDIYGKDSVAMRLVDEDDHVISRVLVPHSSIAGPAKKYHKPYYMKRVERISFRAEPTARIRIIKSLAKVFLHKKKIKPKGDLT